MVNTQNKYTLVIPPSRQDIEIRLFLQTHHRCSTHQQFHNILIKLYEYEHFGRVGQEEPIRVVQASNYIYSDVFIFESCKEKTKYLLVVQTKDHTDVEVDCTLTMLSFVQMYFDKFREVQLLKEVELVTNVATQNVGFGINSPFFHKNLQFLI